MRKAGIFEAKNKLSALIDEVERGGEVTITRRGKAVARLIAPPAVDREVARAAADRIVARSKGVTLDGIDIGELVSAVAQAPRSAPIEQPWSSVVAGVDKRAALDGVRAGDTLVVDYPGSNAMNVNPTNNVNTDGEAHTRPVRSRNLNVSGDAMILRALSYAGLSRA